MGYIRHHAILVTGWDSKVIDEAWRRAFDLFPVVSDVLKSDVNGYCTFVVPPDGSNEGWEESDAGDKARDAFVAYLVTTKYDDGSSRLAWAEVQYGDDELETKITRDSDAERRTK